MSQLELPFVAAIALAPSVLLAPLFLWTRWLARETDAPPSAAWMAYALLALGAFVTLLEAAGACTTVIAALRVESDDGSRARVLASGISESMYYGGDDAVRSRR